MRIIIRLIIIILMALYSYNLHSEIIKVKKGIQPVSPKKPKKSKTETQDEHEREHECEKEKMICEANNG